MKKTSETTIVLIRSLSSQGLTLTEISNRTGVSRGAIQTYTLDLRGIKKLNKCACGTVIKTKAKRCRECNNKLAAQRSKANLERRRKPTESMASPWKESNTHMTYRQYIESGVWKCVKSPTGAHDYDLSASDTGTCRHCGKLHHSREVVVPETVAELEFAVAIL